MDPVKRVREFLLDNVGHLTRPGNASFDAVSQRWFVPICCQTAHGDVVVGDVELDTQGHIVFAPCRDEMVERLKTHAPLPARSRP